MDLLAVYVSLGTSPPTLVSEDRELEEGADLYSLR